MIPPALSRLLVAVSLEGFHRDGADWKCKCPAHADRKASLALKVVDPGKILLHCHAGCQTADILRAWNVEWDVLFPDDPMPNGSARVHQEPEATYDYVDETGNLLFQVCRFPGKRFSQRRLDRSGQWVWNLQHTRRVLYRLPDLIARGAAVVYVCEGEKDVDVLREHGLVATSNPGGAGKWHRDYSAFLKDREVIILPDNDEPGRAHAAAVAKALEGVAETVVILQLSETEHGDVSDWLAEGHTVAELRELTSQASTHVSPEVGVLFANVTPTEVVWLWQSYLARGKITVVVGPPGDGKTMVAIELCARVTSGHGWPDGAFNYAGPAGAVYCSAEDDVADTLLPRFLEARGDPSRAIALSTVGEGTSEREIWLPDDIPLIERAIRRVDARLVVIDPWGGFLSGKLDGNYDQSVRQAMRPLKDMAERTQAAVLVVMHPNKNTSTTAMYRAGGSLGTVAAARIVFACGRDPENHDRRVIAPIKANLTAFPPSLAFTVTTGERAAHIEWEQGSTELTADDVLKAVAPGQEKRNSAVGTAKAMLQIILADQALDRELVVQQIIDAVGCHERTVKRAARELGVISRRTGFGQSALWRLPGVDPRAFDSQDNEAI